MIPILSMICGHRLLQVVTKTALQPQVYEFVMDEAEYERRAQANTPMYKDKIRVRDVGKRSEVT